MTPITLSGFDNIAKELQGHKERTLVCFTGADVAVYISTSETYKPWYCIVTSHFDGGVVVEVVQTWADAQLHAAARAGLGNTRHDVVPEATKAEVIYELTGETPLNDDGEENGEYAYWLEELEDFGL